MTGIDSKSKIIVAAIMLILGLFTLLMAGCTDIGNSEQTGDNAKSPGVSFEGGESSPSQSPPADHSDENILGTTPSPSPADSPETFTDNNPKADVSTPATQDTKSIPNGSNNTKEGLDLNEYVDKQLQVIMKSNAYQDASIDERKQMINQLLSKLKAEKAITNFSYSKDSYLFSFEYCDGTLGGVRIKDFDNTFG